MGQSAETKTLSYNALSAERGVAVQLDAEDAVAELALGRRLLEELHLLGARDAERDGVDGLV